MSKYVSTFILLTIVACSSPQETTIYQATASAPTNTVQLEQPSPTVIPLSPTQTETITVQSAQQGSSGDPIVVPTLEELVATSPMIVIGTIRETNEVINLARNPDDRNQPDPIFVVLGQVYSLEVEQYLKGEGASTLNVVQAEGYIFDQERPVELPTDQATIDAIKRDGAEQAEGFIPMRVGTRYLFFIHPLEGFDPARNYVTTSSGYPWRFTLPLTGNAQPDTPFQEGNALYPPRLPAQLVGEVQDIIQ